MKPVISSSGERYPYITSCNSDGRLYAYGTSILFRATFSGLTPNSSLTITLHDESGYFPSSTTCAVGTGSTGIVSVSRILNSCGSNNEFLEHRLIFTILVNGVSFSAALQPYSYIMDFKKNGIGIGTVASSNSLDVGYKTSFFNSAEMISLDNRVETGYYVKKRSPSSVLHPIYNGVWTGVGISGIDRGLYDGVYDEHEGASTDGRWLIYTDEENVSSVKPIKFGTNNSGVMMNSNAGTTAYITPATGWGIDSKTWMTYARWGRVAFVSARLRRSGDTINAGDIANQVIATLNENICPCDLTTFTVTTTGHIIGGYINNVGNVTLSATVGNIARQTTSGTASISFSALYLLKDGASGIL